MTAAPTSDIPQPDLEVVDTTVRRMLAVLRHEKTPGRVAGYFNHDSDYAGALFETYEPTNPDALEPADLVAITVLSVTVGPPALRKLEQRLGDLNACFARHRIADQHLADATDDDLAPMFEANEILRGIDNIGPTTASKILARKRPHLIPIYDSMIGDAYGHPHRPDGIQAGHWWVTYRECIRRSEIGEAIKTVRGRASETSPDADIVSDLRILDVATWRAIKAGFNTD